MDKTQGEVMVYGVLVDERSVFDDTDGTITAKEFDRAVKSLGDIKSLLIRINSKGGSVWAGEAIAEMIDTLRRNGIRVVSKIEGLGASMGFFFPQASDEIIMSSNALFMMHPPMAGAVGSKKDLTAATEMLAKAEENLITLCMRRFKGTRDELVELMNKNGEVGTWLTAQEAFDYGFCDTIIEPVEMAACTGGYRMNGLVVPTVALIGAADKIQTFEKEGGENLIYNKETDLKIKAILDSGKAVHVTANGDSFDVTEIEATATKTATAFLTTEQAEKIDILDGLDSEKLIASLSALSDAGINLNDIQGSMEALKQTDTVLVAKAAERDVMFEALIEEALANGVRAEGNSFDKDWWSKSLTDQPMAKIKEFSEKWLAKAEQDLHAGQGRLSKVPEGIKAISLNPDDYIL